MMTCPTPGSPCPRCSAPLAAFSPAGLGDAACDDCQVYWLEEEPYMGSEDLAAGLCQDAAQWEVDCADRWTGEVVVFRGDFTDCPDGEVE